MANNNFDPAPQYNERITVKEALKRGAKAGVVTGGVALVVTATGEYVGGKLKEAVQGAGGLIGKLFS